MGLTPDATNPPAAAGADRPLLVWCLLRDQHAHVEPVERHFGQAAKFVHDAAWDPNAMLERRPDLVLCVNDYHYDVARCLDAARANGIPSLVLQDGILEWRCQYENPLFGAGGGAPQHQPVLADKIACLGASSARHIASWGNASRVEVTGMPRLDALTERPVPPPQRPGRRLLVMTAKKPWYGDSQRIVIERSLSSLKAFLETVPEVDVTWRLTRGLAETLGVENRLKDLETRELSVVLAEVDAVVTTPSTAVLEAMLTGRPVAVLDYFNAPRFVATAWTISADAHLASVVPELLQPSASKMLFQSECLRDSLFCEEPAAARVRRLIEVMAADGHKSRGRRVPLRLGAHLLGGAEAARNGVLPALSALYPGQPSFLEEDVSAMRARLLRVEKDYERLCRGSLAARISRRVRRIMGSS